MAKFFVVFYAMSCYFLGTLPELGLYIAVGGSVIVGIPILMLVNELFRPTPMPTHVSIVSAVKFVFLLVLLIIGLFLGKRSLAKATEHQSISQAGRHTSGMLEVTFENPDKYALSSLKFCTFSFACGEGGLQWQYGSACAAIWK